MAPSEIEAQMLAKARRSVLAGGAYVAIESRPGAGEAVRAGRLFAIRVDGQELVPTWAFEAAGEPIEGLAAIIRVLRPYRDDWGINFWFAGINSRLGNRAPLQALRSDPQAVLEAARSEIRAQLYD